MTAWHWIVASCFPHRAGLPACRPHLGLFPCTGHDMFGTLKEEEVAMTMRGVPGLSGECAAAGDVEDRGMRRGIHNYWRCSAHEHRQMRGALWIDAVGAVMDGDNPPGIDQLKDVG